MSQRFIKIIIIILIVAIAGTAGYFALVKNQTPSTPASGSQSNIDNCNAITNSSFRSINQYEVGLGPNGEVMGYWDIQFQNPHFQWHHSDVSERGTYTCKDNVLQVKLFNLSVTAYYDESKKVLTWDGVAYKNVE